MTTPAAPTIQHVDPDTGEVTERPAALAEVAQLWADAHTDATRLRREIATLRAALTEREHAAAVYSAAILEHATPGDIIADTTAGTVIARHGRRRNATINRHAADTHAEPLAALGLRTEEPAPPPPPTVTYASVSAYRAAEVDLARAGIRLADLIIPGGDGAPELTIA